MATLESSLKETCLAYLKKRYPDVWVVKISDRWISGIPDLIVCNNGRFMAFELKAERGVVSRIQQATIERIRKAGGFAAVIRSLDELKEAL